MPVHDSAIGEGTFINDNGLVNIYGAQIGRGCRIGSFVEIGPAVIGDNCNIQAKSFIPEGVVIGNGVFVGPGVIFTNDKYPPSGGKWRLERQTIVEDEVSIGAGAIILPGVRIGKGARIAAGAIISKDVEDGELWISKGASRKS